VIVLLLAALIAAPRAPRGGGPPREPAAAPQLSEVELRESVEAYLGAIDRPIPKERWQALGPKAAPLLEAVIADPAQFPTRRAKALDGLVASAPDRAAELVGKLARDDKQPPVVRVAAMHGAAQVFPASRALQELRPVLKTGRTAGLRAEAADVISRKQGGCAEVRDQVAREKQEHRPAFERALKRCGE
jgi:hypothetical protein